MSRSVPAMDGKAASPSSMVEPHLTHWPEEASLISPDVSEMFNPDDATLQKELKKLIDADGEIIPDDSSMQPSTRYFSSLKMARLLPFSKKKKKKAWRAALEDEKRQSSSNQTLRGSTAGSISSSSPTSAAHHLEHAQRSFASLHMSTSSTHAVIDFFRDHHCYEIMPTSSKLVIMDTSLNIKKAFFALIWNGLRAGILWSTKKHKLVGLLTVTDFIHVIMKFAHEEGSLQPEILEEKSIQDWLDFENHVDRMYTLSSTHSILDAIQTLRDKRIHRLPVVDADTKNIMCIVTHKRILKFFHLHLKTLILPPFLSRSCRDLGVGTFDKIAVVKLTDQLNTVLDRFIALRVSAFPVVNEEGEMVSLFSKFDVIFLAAQGSYTNMNLTVKEIIDAKSSNGPLKKPLTVTETTPMFDVLDKFVKYQVHRLIILNDQERISGVISLSDLLGFLVDESFLKTEEIASLSS